MSPNPKNIACHSGFKLVPWLVAAGVTFVSHAQTRYDGAIDVPPSAIPQPALQQGAEEGDAQRMLQLAWRYDQGRGVKRDEERVMEWLKQAADLGHPQAQAALAHRMLHGPFGEGYTDKNAKRALKLYQQAGEQGYAPALHEWGVMRLRGEAVKQDEEAGHASVLEAAEAGYAPAMVVVGRNLQMGRGVEEDSAAARVWWQKAANLKNVDAMVEMARAYLNGEGVKENERLATAWFTRAAREGHTDAMWDLISLKRGDPGVNTGIDRDVLIWYRQLIERGDARATFEMAESAPEELAKIAKPLRVQSGRILSPAGSVVKIEGRVVDFTRQKWKVQLTARAAAKAEVQLDASSLEPEKLEEGYFVVVYGRVNEDHRLTGMVVQAPAPEYEYKFTMKKGGVAGGGYQTFIVNGLITNKGPQTIKKLQVNVNLSQPSSPNNETKQVILTDLPPGQSVKRTLRFNWYNYEYIGASSMPRLNTPKRARVFEW
ncbi:MAG: hypothetical protein ACYTGQ_14570 [Planctomycetota bacterium]|jgi:TPR repeat protein